MDTAGDEEEDDDPTSSSLPQRKSDLAVSISTAISPPAGTLQNDENEEEKSTENEIPEDVLFLCFEWLYPSELARCGPVNHQWNEAARDNHLWKVHCAMCFHRVSSRHLSSKYSNSFHQYYHRHRKIRFDGVYVLKVLYYIQSEAGMLSLENGATRFSKPYTTIEYYRYLRFFNNQCTVTPNGKVKREETSKAMYAMSKRKPGDFPLFRCFQSVDASHLNFGKGPVLAAYHEKNHGITTDEKVFAAKYDISDRKRVKVTVDTDYRLRIVLGLNYSYEFIEGASDRLTIEQFYGVRVDREGNPIGNMRDHYDIRHEPFRFIPDTSFREVHQMFQ